jgi:hypothetical protein
MFSVIDVSINYGIGTFRWTLKALQCPTTMFCLDRKCTHAKHSTLGRKESHVFVCPNHADAHAFYLIMHSTESLLQAGI